MEINFPLKLNDENFSNQEPFQTVIIDNGSYLTKVGFAGEDEPKIAFETIVGRIRSPHSILVGMNIRDSYIGEEAKKKRGILMMRYPVQNGIITDWDNIEKIWFHSFYNELRVAPEEHPVLLTEPPLNPKLNREKTIQIMFETFDVPALYLANQSVLSLYQSGRKSGIVVHIGDGFSSVVPVYEMFALNHAIIKQNLAGKDLTEYLVNMLNEKGNQFFTSREIEMVNDIKEKLGYVAYDFDEEMQFSKQSISSVQKDYELPEQDIIQIGNERFKCCEALFNPHLIEREEKGIHQMIYDSIMKCSDEMKTDLYQNIILSGGSSMIPGIEYRIQKEIYKLNHSDSDIKIISSPERKYSSWIGGSILVSILNFKDMWISKEEYEEFGPIFINRKCF
ncbi:actin-10-related [Anaeramoeba ignava]|uniref:Actin-10-related n=1 Tax=Anaeramoeba ignava TaxID=1746090 RepID=A0A9Q0LLK3_ANAIG|nr:actin-10-related [Anaeramoeba ignava]